MREYLFTFSQNDFCTTNLLKSLKNIIDNCSVQPWRLRRRMREDLFTFSQNDCCTINLLKSLKNIIDIELIIYSCTISLHHGGEAAEWENILYLFTFSQNDSCTINLLKSLKNIIDNCSVQYPCTMAAKPPNERRSFHFLSKWFLYNKPFEIS